MSASRVSPPNLPYSPGKAPQRPHILPAPKASAARGARKPASKTAAQHKAALKKQPKQKAAARRITRAKAEIEKPAAVPQLVPCEVATVIATPETDLTAVAGTAKYSPSIQAQPEPEFFAQPAIEAGIADAPTTQVSEQPLVDCLTQDFEQESECEITAESLVESHDACEAASSPEKPSLADSLAMQWTIFARAAAHAWRWVREKFASQQEKKRLRVCETVSLGEKRFIAVIQVDGEQFLVGGSSNSVSTLAHLEPRRGFSDVLKSRCEQGVSQA